MNTKHPQLKPPILGLLAVVGLALTTHVTAQTEPVDYSDADSWLCRGAESDLGACDVDLTTTIVAADGRLTTAMFTPFTRSALRGGIAGADRSLGYNNVLSNDCGSSGTHRYLELSVHANAADPRTDDSAGDILTAEGTPDAGWGLHLLDANVGMGDLLSILDKQAVVYLGKQ